MKRDAFVVFLCFVAGMAGSNVQPVLTGAGKILFPENATPATISASSGALTLAAGGTNQNVSITPSGTGIGQVTRPLLVGSAGPGSSAQFTVHPGTNENLAVTGAVDMPNGVVVQSYNDAVNADEDLELSAAAFRFTQGNVGIGANPGFALDNQAGDTNTVGVYRKSGVAGVGTGSSITVCTGGACTSSCTLIFNGGIRTGGTCP